MLLQFFTLQEIRKYGKETNSPMTKVVGFLFYRNSIFEKTTLYARRIT